MWLTIFIILITALLSLVKDRKLRMSILQRNGIRGPQPHLLWGNLPEYFGSDNVIWDSDLTKKYGPVSGYYMGAKPVILVSEPFLIDKIQVEHGNAYLGRPRRVPGGINPCPKRAKMLGNVDVGGWMFLRRILNKAFSPSRLKGMSTQVSNLSQVFMKKVSPNTRSVDFYILFQNFTLDLIGKTGFGIHSDIQNNPNDNLKRAVEQEFSKSTNSYLLKTFLCCPEIQWLLQPVRVFLEKINSSVGLGSHSELWSLGASAVSQREAGGTTSTTSSPDLLQVMLDSTKLSGDQIVANSVLFFEAGFETLSAALAFTTYLLIKHPDVQARVREEIQDVLRETDGVCKFSNSGLPKFPWLEAVIKESLRMYPPQTTFIGRSGVSDIEHKFIWNGAERVCTIPKNVHIQVGLFQILNSEEIWDSPRTFMPQRFMEEDENEERRRLQSIAYQPFGRGKRMCIGRKYADMVLTMVLVELLSEYKLLPSEDTEDEIELVYKTATMTPKNGVFGKPESDPLFK